MHAHLRLGLLYILCRLLVPLAQPLNSLGAEPELGDPVLPALHQISVISNGPGVGLFAQLQQAARRHCLDYLHHWLGLRCRSC